jgi:hypothetical protein
MVPPAPDARASGAIGSPIRTESLPTAVSVAGKPNFQAREKSANSSPNHRSAVSETKRSYNKPANSGPFSTTTGNLHNRPNAWWGWKDSNLQPGGYELEGLELSWKDSNLQPGRYERTSSAAQKSEFSRLRDERTQSTCQACSSVETSLRRGCRRARPRAPR